MTVTAKPKRRHGISMRQRTAVVVLFNSGFQPRVVGRLLGLTTDEVLRAMRRAFRGARA